MREIKFRGKGIEVDVKDKWIYGDLIHCDSTHYGNQFFIKEILLDDESDEWLVDYGTVGQYTGLKDKNGKEIYEGDIVKDKKGFGLVKWLPCNCAFGVLELTTFNKNKPIEEQEYYKLNCGEPRQLKESEVIGNIYDNPEYMKFIDNPHWVQSYKFHSDIYGCPIEVKSE